MGHCNGETQQKISASLHMVRIRTEGMGGWLLVRLRLGQYGGYAWVAWYAMVCLPWVTLTARIPP